MHVSWEEIVDAADGAPLVRVHVLGSLIVVATTPEAHDVITRKHRFIPKMPAVYNGFTFFGYKAPAIIQMDSESEHTRVRKELGRFFSCENIQTVIERLTVLMQDACMAAVHATATAARDTARVDARDMAQGVIDGVIRKVCHAGSPGALLLTKRGS